MNAENIALLDKLCDDLRKRAALNRPFDAEGLIGTLLLMAESIRALAAPPTNQTPVVPPKEPVPAVAPKEPQTEQRHL